ncbi:tyrosine-type recombinase/integrase [Aetokthonos hydrillicola Thurmond2011]|jgi:integrase/recombinase XerC|uniref:Tyrosine-type recombinase/integrase n=1 Tax=Aetokthonos hydrillicola Thurmond2011 TaxID=2712845 RepID=A0AAP5M8E0_9CYAN|nr:tyrosine-type recombinase/integrase [Aetokthonos hydrillicola]MBO3457682.1 tyrosine-type recombinase/integrase [Aetokthonos hydrillicola CCALA 1050]MBW4587961.1 tyrosine-type recombinase/integrase [Aetokthonos hydrillicola CCALA 1050]MDR9894632.1 tyrosine-type recombinase/integrase [Aetokthonos hydrillicola Thurmond2011]
MLRTNTENSIASVASLLQTSDDFLAELQQKALTTQRGYAGNVRIFFEYFLLRKPTSQDVNDFWALDGHTANTLILKFKNHLVSLGRKPATINRYLAAIKYLIKVGRNLNRCQFYFDGDRIESLKVTPYRDTRGVDASEYNKVFDVIDTTCVKGKRDYALFLLLWANALRRGEVAKLTVGDFDYHENTLTVYGKGKGNDETRIDLNPEVADAISDWLGCRTNVKPRDPLFIALDFYNYGHQLTGDGIYAIVRNTCFKARIKKRMTPHKIRHSGITDALDLAEGDYRKVQHLSRHADPRTILVYEDNKNKYQLELTNKLASRVGKKPRDH